MEGNSFFKITGNEIQQDYFEKTLKDDGEDGYSLVAISDIKAGF